MQLLLENEKLGCLGPVGSGEEKQALCFPLDRLGLHMMAGVLAATLCPAADSVTSRTTLSLGVEVLVWQSISLLFRLILLSLIIRC